MFSFTIKPEVISTVRAQLNKNEKRLIRNADKCFM